MTAHRLIEVDTIGTKKFLVMKTEINGEEYDPDMPTTPTAWEELRQHMNRKSWWTIEHELEFQDLQAEYSK